MPVTTANGCIISRRPTIRRVRQSIGVSGSGGVQQQTGRAYRVGREHDDVSSLEPLPTNRVDVLRPGGQPRAPRPDIPRRGPVDEVSAATPPDAPAPMTRTSARPFAPVVSRTSLRWLRADLLPREHRAAPSVLPR